MQSSVICSNREDLRQRRLDESSAARLAVSIVLFCTDDETLITTLRSLARACDSATEAGWLTEVRLMLTDHSPRAASEARIERWRQASRPIPTEYRHDPHNPGYGAGHNAAFGHMKDTDYFLVANPDVEFAEDSLVGALSFLAYRVSIGVIAPALVERAGLRPACFSYPSLTGLLLRGLGVGASASRAIARYECRHWNALEPRYDPPLMSGCCLLFRAEAYARVAGFDHSYFLYFEDFDLSLRARQAGLTSAYCPSMRVKHKGGRAVRKGWRHRIYFLRSAWRFFTTHGWQP